MQTFPCEGRMDGEMDEHRRETESYSSLDVLVLACLKGSFVECQDEFPFQRIKLAFCTATLGSNGMECGRAAERYEVFVHFSAPELAPDPKYPRLRTPAVGCSALLTRSEFRGIAGRDSGCPALFCSNLSCRIPARDK